MKIGLVDVDGHSGFPNLALMRLSAWHKAQDDDVEWWNGFTHYDRVYLSKVFTFTADFDTVIDADEIITGGTGYKDYTSLPPEVETTLPDYSIYPHYQRAIGFLTRGCIRDCPWCIVPRKEGYIHPAATWEEIKRPDSREIIFLDNNVLASGHGLEQIGRMGGEPVWVDFNQGLDARLITPETAALLAGLHWIRFVRLSCDTSAMLPIIEQATAYLREAGVAPSRFWAYVLVKDVSNAHRRVLALEKMGVISFAQPYRDYLSLFLGDGMFQYTEYGGATIPSLGNVRFTDGVTDVVYFNQLDQQYANKPYGTDNIGGYGCGPTSMSIVVSSLTDDIVDPVEMAEWAYKNGGWCSKSGSYHSLIPNAAKAWGLPVEGCTASEPQRILDALGSGKLVVAIMTKGHFTSGGHFIVLRGVKDGQILVADPASYKRSEKSWDLPIILNEASKRAGAGGPFWIIGL